ncbi:hypothetical protein [Paenibacillus sp. OV219]|uniref:hypothetical protein n=1 Tax=Paenibacillus sp. OV219 TaxID=1884377 RepID=UPI0008B847B2|nr:hypothetical protein [Paenibacillus sp. OV219]SEM57030.1 hypothetical protein SAMN05518847_101187 [Paenibacillus sp. OV219]
MDYILFVIGSTFEYIGMFLFLFALFRFGLYTRLIMNVVIVSVLMSQVSYFTRLDSSVGDLSSYIQFFLFVVVLWLLFQVPLFHSIVMNFAGLAATFGINGIIILIAIFLGDISLDTIQSTQSILTSFQFVTFLAEIGIARSIYIMNWGFDFVPTSRRSYVQIKGTNAILMAIISTSIVIAAVLAFVFRNDYNDYVFYASFVFLCTLPIFLYFSLRKDVEDAT